jgi:hypothetical protein
MLTTRTSQIAKFATSEMLGWSKCVNSFAAAPVYPRHAEQGKNLLSASPDTEGIRS